MALLGEEGRQIFQELNGKSFSANEIARVFGIGIDEVDQFLSFLLLKGMLSSRKEIENVETQTVDK